MIRALGKARVSLREYAVLELVREQVQCVGLHRLARMMGICQSSLSFLLRGLELRGLVLVESALADRRRKVLSITAGGLALCLKVERWLA